MTADQAGTTEMQDGFIANIGGAEVIDLDSGHMAMISQPAALAAILDELAARVSTATQKSKNNCFAVANSCVVVVVPDKQGLWARGPCGAGR